MPRPPQFHEKTLSTLPPYVSLRRLPQETLAAISTESVRPHYRSALSRDLARLGASPKPTAVPDGRGLQGVSPDPEAQRLRGVHPPAQLRAHRPDAALALGGHRPPVSRMESGPRYLLVEYWNSSERPLPEIAPAPDSLLYEPSIFSEAASYEVTLRADPSWFTPLPSRVAWIAACEHAEVDYVALYRAMKHTTFTELREAGVSQTTSKPSLGTETPGRPTSTISATTSDDSGRWMRSGSWSAGDKRATNEIAGRGRASPRSCCGRDLEANGRGGGIRTHDAEPPKFRL